MYLLPKLIAVLLKEIFLGGGVVFSLCLFCVYILCWNAAAIDFANQFPNDVKTYAC